MAIERHPEISCIEVGTELDFANLRNSGHDADESASDEVWEAKIIGFGDIGMSMQTKEHALEMAEKTLFLDENYQNYLNEILRRTLLDNPDYTLLLIERRGYWKGRAEAIAYAAKELESIASRILVLANKLSK